MDKHKLILPAGIILGCIILGAFYYASEENKSRSIEKQQQSELQAKKEADEAKAEQDNKEYIAKRKNDCYDIYLQEKKSWNNVSEFDYSELRDVCIIHYKSDQPPRTKEECNKMLDQITYETNKILAEIIYFNNTDCLNNNFSKVF